MFFWLLIWKYICHEKEIEFSRIQKIIVKNEISLVQMFFRLLISNYISYEKRNEFSRIQKKNLLRMENTILR